MKFHILERSILLFDFIQNFFYFWFDFFGIFDIESLKWCENIIAEGSSQFHCFNKIIKQDKQSQIQMSERMQQSDSNSMDQNIQFQKNDQGQNQIYIPIWEEQGSSSTQLNHLMEQIRILKNKCNHLENHLEENHREFSSLNQLYLISETNEKKVMKENQQLRKRYISLLSEHNYKKNQLEILATELENSTQRENDMKQRMKKMKEREVQMMGRIQTLQNQLELYKRKALVSPKNIGYGQQEKWKKSYSQQIVSIEDKWKRAYEQLQGQFDKKSKQFRDKAQQLKNLNKTYINYRQQAEQTIRSLQSEIEQLRKQLNKSKLATNQFQRQLKDLRQVLEDVSTKNDDIQRENAKLKTKLTQQANRYSKVNNSLLEAQQDLGQAKKSIQEKERQIFTLNNNINEGKMRESLLERTYSESKIEIQKLSMNNSYLESLVLNLREQLQNLKRKKDTEIHQTNETCEQRIKDLKRIQEEDKNKLNRRIADLEAEAEQLRQKLKLLKIEMQKVHSANQQNEDLLAIRDQAFKFKEQVANWKSKLEIANRKIKDLQDQSFSAKDCGHTDQIVKYKAQVLKLTASNSESLRKYDQISEQFEQTNIKLLEQVNRIQNLIQQLDKINREKKRYQQDIQNFNRQKNNLIGQIQSLNSELQRLRRSQFESSPRIAQKDQRYQKLQREYSQKNSIIHQLEIKIIDLENQVENLKEKRIEEVHQEKGLQKDKSKKLQAKITEKNRLIQQLQAKVQELQTNLQTKDQRIRLLQKELKVKDTEIAKKQRKTRQLQAQLQGFKAQEEENRLRLDKLKTQSQSLKKQLKSQQNMNEKLKQQLMNTSHDQKQNNSKLNLMRQNEKMKSEWQQKIKRLTSQLRNKQQVIIEVKNQIKNTKIYPFDDSSNSDALNELKSKIKDFQSQLIFKTEIIAQLQQQLKKYKNQTQQSSDNLAQLQAEYARELSALKRLILYKGQKQEESRKYEDLKNDYESKIQLFLVDYKNMQEEMLILKQQVLAQPTAPVMMPPPIIDVFAIQQAWKIRFQELCRERQILLDKVDLWQRRYQELKYLYQAKLQSKEQTINLLNLKISNLDYSYQGINRCCYKK